MSSLGKRSAARDTSHHYGHYDVHSVHSGSYFGSPDPSMAGYSSITSPNAVVSGSMIHGHVLTTVLPDGTVVNASPAYIHESRVDPLVQGIKALQPSLDASYHSFNTFVNQIHARIPILRQATDSIVKNVNVYASDLLGDGIATQARQSCQQALRGESVPAVPSLLHVHLTSVDRNGNASTTTTNTEALAQSMQMGQMGAFASAPSLPLGPLKPLRAPVLFGLNSATLPLSQASSDTVASTDSVVSPPACSTSSVSSTCTTSTRTTESSAASAVATASPSTPPAASPHPLAPHPSHSTANVVPFPASAATEAPPASPDSTPTATTDTTPAASESLGAEQAPEPASTVATEPVLGVKMENAGSGSAACAVDTSMTDTQAPSAAVAEASGAAGPSAAPPTAPPTAPPAAAPLGSSTSAADTPAPALAQQSQQAQNNFYGIHNGVPATLPDGGDITLYAPEVQRHILALQQTLLPYTHPVTPYAQLFGEGGVLHAQLQQQQQQLQQQQQMQLQQQQLHQQQQLQQQQLAQQQQAQMQQLQLQQAQLHQQQLQQAQLQQTQLRQQQQQQQAAAGTAMTDAETSLLRVPAPALPQEASLAQPPSGLFEQHAAVATANTGNAATATAAAAVAAVLGSPQQGSSLQDSPPQGSPTQSTADAVAALQRQIQHQQQLHHQQLHQLQQQHQYQQQQYQQQVQQQLQPQPLVIPPSVAPSLHYSPVAALWVLARQMQATVQSTAHVRQLAEATGAALEVWRGQVCDVLARLARRLRYPWLITDVLQLPTPVHTVPALGRPPKNKFQAAAALSVLARVLGVPLLVVGEPGEREAMQAIARARGRHGGQAASLAYAALNMMAPVAPFRGAFVGVDAQAIAQVEAAAQRAASTAAAGEATAAVRSQPMLPASSDESMDSTRWLNARSSPPASPAATAGLLRSSSTHHARANISAAAAQLSPPSLSVHATAPDALARQSSTRSVRGHSPRSTAFAASGSGSGSGHSQRHLRHDTLSPAFPTTSTTASPRAQLTPARSRALAARARAAQQTAMLGMSPQPSLGTALDAWEAAVEVRAGSAASKASHLQSFGHVAAHVPVAVAALLSPGTSAGGAPASGLSLPMDLTGASALTAPLSAQARTTVQNAWCWLTGLRGGAQTRSSASARAGAISAASASFVGGVANGRPSKSSALAGSPAETEEAKSDVRSDIVRRAVHAQPALRGPSSQGWTTTHAPAADAAVPVVSCIPVLAAEANAVAAVKVEPRAEEAAPTDAPLIEAAAVKEAPQEASQAATTCALDRLNVIVSAAAEASVLMRADVVGTAVLEGGEARAGTGEAAATSATPDLEPAPRATAPETATAALAPSSASASSGTSATAETPDMVDVEADTSNLARAPRGPSALALALGSPSVRAAVALSASVATFPLSLPASPSLSAASSPLSMAAPAATANTAAPAFALATASPLAGLPPVTVAPPPPRAAHSSSVLARDNAARPSSRAVPARTLPLPLYSLPLYSLPPTPTPLTQLPADAVVALGLTDEYIDSKVTARRARHRPPPPRPYFAVHVDTAPAKEIAKPEEPVIDVGPGAHLPVSLPPMPAVPVVRARCATIPARIPLALHAARAATRAATPKQEAAEARASQVMGAGLLTTDVLTHGSSSASYASLAGADDGGPSGHSHHTGGRTTQNSTCVNRATNHNTVASLQALQVAEARPTEVCVPQLLEAYAAFASALQRAKEERAARVQVLMREGEAEVRAREAVANTITEGGVVSDAAELPATLPLEDTPSMEDATTTAAPTPPGPVPSPSPSTSTSHTRAARSKAIIDVSPPLVRAFRSLQSVCRALRRRSRRRPVARTRPVWHPCAPAPAHPPPPRITQPLTQPPPLPAPARPAPPPVLPLGRAPGAKGIATASGPASMVAAASWAAAGGAAPPVVTGRAPNASATAAFYSRCTVPFVDDTSVLQLVQMVMNCNAVGGQVTFDTLVDIGAYMSSVIPQMQAQIAASTAQQAPSAQAQTRSTPLTTGGATGASTTSALGGATTKTDTKVEVKTETSPAPVAVSTVASTPAGQPPLVSDALAVHTAAALLLYCDRAVNRAEGRWASAQLVPQPSVSAGGLLNDDVRRAARPADAAHALYKSVVGRPHPGCARFGVLASSPLAADGSVVPVHGQPSDTSRGEPLSLPSNSPTPAMSLPVTESAQRAAHILQLGGTRPHPYRLPVLTSAEAAALPAAAMCLARSDPLVCPLFRDASLTDIFEVDVRSSIPKYSPDTVAAVAVAPVARRVSKTKAKASAARSPASSLPSHHSNASRDSDIYTFASPAASFAAPSASSAASMHTLHNVPEGRNRKRHLHGDLHVPLPLHDAPELPTAATEDDDDATLYCFCQRPSFGEMVGCEHEGCRYQWFHFECVGLDKKPRGHWYCVDCIESAHIPNKNKAKLKAMADAQASAVAAHRRHPAPQTQAPLLAGDVEACERSLKHSTLNVDTAMQSSHVSGKGIHDVDGELLQSAKRRRRQ